MKPLLAAAIAALALWAAACTGNGSAPTASPASPSSPATTTPQATTTAAPVDAPQATTFTLSGTVTDGTSGGVLPNIYMQITAGANSGAVTRTDSTGAYALSGLAPGAFTLSASNVSYVTTTRSITLTASARADLVIQRINVFTPVSGAAYQVTLNIPFREGADAAACAVDGVMHPYVFDGTLVASDRSALFTFIQFPGFESYQSDPEIGVQLTLAGSQFSGTFLPLFALARSAESTAGDAMRRLYVARGYLFAEPARTSGGITADGKGVSGTIDGYVQVVTPNATTPPIQCGGHFTWSLVSR